VGLHKFSEEELGRVKHNLRNRNHKQRKMTDTGSASGALPMKKGEQLRSLFQTKLRDAANVQEAQKFLDWIASSPFPQEKYAIPKKLAATLQSYLPVGDRAAVEDCAGHKWFIVSRLSGGDGKVTGRMYEARNEYIARNIDLPMICAQLELEIMDKDYKKGDLVQLHMSKLGSTWNTQLITQLLEAEGINVRVHDHDESPTSYTVYLRTDLD